MSSSSSSKSGGIGFVGVLQIVFIVLKLTGNIDWSWWWVMSPAIFTVGLAVLLTAILLIAVAVSD